MTFVALHTFTVGVAVCLIIVHLKCTKKPTLLSMTTEVV